MNPMPLTFQSTSFERETIDSATMTLRDAKRHAEHLASEYGESIDIFDVKGKLLATVREYGS